MKQSKEAIFRPKHSLYKLLFLSMFISLDFKYSIIKNPDKVYGNKK